jgi:hypothetical protein
MLISFSICGAILLPPARHVPHVVHPDRLRCACRGRLGRGRYVLALFGDR